MGLPYKAKSLNIISIAIDADKNTIEELSDKIKVLEGITVNVAYNED